MAGFPKFILTNNGIALQAKAQGGATMNFTRMAMGEGNLNSIPVNTLTSLISQKATISLTGGRVTGGNTYEIKAYFSNAAITTGFWWREWGVFATDPDVGEILYAYSNAGGAADFIPPITDNRIERYHYVTMTIGNTTNVTVNISGSNLYLPQADYDAHVAATVIAGKSTRCTPVTSINAMKAIPFAGLIAGDRVTVFGTGDYEYDPAQAYATGNGSTIVIPNGKVAGSTGAWIYKGALTQKEDKVAGRQLAVAPVQDVTALKAIPFATLQMGEMCYVYANGLYIYNPALSCSQETGTTFVAPNGKMISDYGMWELQGKLSDKKSINNLVASQSFNTDPFTAGTTKTITTPMGGPVNTCVAHGFTSYQLVRFGPTNLPAQLSVNTDYWISVQSADTFVIFSDLVSSTYVVITPTNTSFTLTFRLPTTTSIDFTSLNIPSSCNRFTIGIKGDLIRNTTGNNASMFGSLTINGITTAGSYYAVASSNLWADITSATSLRYAQLITAVSSFGTNNAFVDIVFTRITGGDWTMSAHFGGALRTGATQFTGIGDAFAGGISNASFNSITSITFNFSTAPFRNGTITIRRD